MQATSTIRPFTLIGFYLKDEMPEPLYVHVHNATSADEAREQLQAGFPHNAVFKTYEGHLMPLDGRASTALHLMGPGVLQVEAPGQATMPAPRRARP